MKHAQTLWHRFQCVNLFVLAQISGYQWTDGTRVDFLDWISDEDNFSTYAVNKIYWRLPLYRLPWQVNTSNIGQPVKYKMPHRNCTGILFNDVNGHFGWLAIPCSERMQASYICKMNNSLFNHTDIRPTEQSNLNSSVLLKNNDLTHVSLCHIGYILAAEKCFLIQKLHSVLQREEAREYCRLNNSTLLSINPGITEYSKINILDSIFSDLRTDLLFDLRAEIRDPGTHHLLNALRISNYKIRDTRMTMGHIKRYPGERIILERILKNYALVYPNINRLIEVFAALLQQLEGITIWVDVHTNTSHTKQIEEQCCRLFVDQAASLFNKYSEGLVVNHTLHMGCLDCMSNKSANYVICKRPVLTIDELHCAAEYFVCPSGYCVSRARVCDGLWDCANGADEQNCSMKSLKNRLTSEWDICVSGNYCSCGMYGTISIDVSCDGVHHCPHGRDEYMCHVVHRDDRTAFYQPVNKLLETNTGKVSHGGSMSGLRFSPNNESKSEQHMVYVGLETALFCKDGSMFAAVDLCYFIPGAYNGCRDKSHLFECGEFNCQLKFKCHVGFCLDYHRVCDGQVDCPDGEDEDKSMCGVHVCAGRLKCHGEQRCLDSQQLCDGVQDCKYTADDEIACHCPDMCICQKNTAICNSLDDPTVLRFISSIIIKTDFQGIQVDLSFMYHMTRLLAFDISHCNISSFTVSKHKNHIIYANLSHNALTELSAYFIHIHNKLILLDASYNTIRTLEYRWHRTQSRIETLLLNSNELIDLPPNMMLMFQQLILLDIRDNKLTMISASSMRTLRHIFTTSHIICCVISKDTKCSLSLQGHQLCSALFTRGQVLYFVMLGILLFISNLLFLLKTIVLALKISTGNVCLVFDCSLMLSNILMCCYVCGILLVNLTYNNVYNEFIVYWQQSGKCSLLLFISNLSISQGVTTFSLKSMSTYISVLRPFRCDYKSLKSGNVPISIAWVFNCLTGFVLVYMTQISNGSLNYENVVSAKNLCSLLMLGKLKVNMYWQLTVPFLQCLSILNILIYITCACGIVMTVRQSNSAVRTNRKGKYKRLPYFKIGCESAIVMLIYCTVVLYWITLSLGFVDLDTQFVWPTMSLSVAVCFSYIISFLPKWAITKLCSH